MFKRNLESGSNKQLKDVFGLAPTNSQKTSSVWLLQTVKRRLESGYYKQLKEITSLAPTNS